MKNLFSKRGFTLVELLIVIVIIGILAAALVPKIGTSKIKAEDAGKKSDLQQIATALIAYQIDLGSFPAGSGKIDSKTTGVLGAALTGGGLNSIPGGSNSYYIGLDGQVVSGYIYYAMKKNSMDNGGFIIVTNVSSHGAANYVYTGAIPSINTTDINLIVLCDKVTEGVETSCSTSDKSKLRYIYKY